MPKPFEAIPGQRGHFLTGDIPEIKRDRVQFLLDLRRDCGDVARVRFGPFTAVAVFHPDGVQRVLQDNHTNYTKDTRTYATVRELAGNGLLTSDGDFWLRQRRLMAPAFHQQRINTLAEMICGEASAVLEGWEPVARGERPIDVAHEMMRLALSVATLALFGSKVHDPDGVLPANIPPLMRDTAFRFEHPFYPPRWVPAPRNREFNAALAKLDRVVYDLISERRKHQGDHEDLLAMLMRAQDGDDAEKMTDKQLRDEVVTLLLAGHDTTAIALSWTLYFLSLHPDVETRLRGEVDGVLSGRRPTLADLPRLTCTRMVLDEAMRLRPPAWLIERRAVADDEIGGYRIPAGTTLALSQYVTHRHPEFWEDPERFDPERFAPERSEARPRYAYFPFGGGPRQCIGKSLALLETHLVLPMILQRYRLELEPGREVRTEPELSLRLRGGLWMRVRAA